PGPRAAGGGPTTAPLPGGRAAAAAQPGEHVPGDGRHRGRAGRLPGEGPGTDRPGGGHRPEPGTLAAAVVPARQGGRASEPGGRGTATAVPGRGAADGPGFLLEGQHPLDARPAEGGPAAVAQGGGAGAGQLLGLVQPGQLLRLAGPERPGGI